MNKENMQKILTDSGLTAESGQMTKDAETVLLSKVLATQIQEGIESGDLAKVQETVNRVKDIAKLNNSGDKTDSKDNNTANSINDKSNEEKMDVAKLSKNIQDLSEKVRNSTDISVKVAGNVLTRLSELSEELA